MAVNTEENMEEDVKEDMETLQDRTA